jgi:phosphoribosylamine--glycine ligase
MNILLLGSGGREHALAWKLSQSPRCEQLFIAPGNAGTAEVGTNVALALDDFDGLYEFVQEQQIELVIVGPEQPLVDGIADFFAEKGIPLLGPSREAAQLEGSKAFSKEFMQRHGIPTATYACFQQGQENELQNYLADHSLPIVVKANGLAAGKGVLICDSPKEALTEALAMLSGTAFGEAGSTVVVEEFLTGIEISIFVLSDGKDYLILPSAKDYKRIGEGDTGLNTGGMGAVSPVPFADQAFLAEVEETIVKPSLEGLHQEGMPFNGFLFIGLMVVDGKPSVLEYNVRMGDPETEVVMPRIQSDFVDLCAAAAKGQLAGHSLQTDPRTCVTVMLVSGGYPGSYEKGKVMSGLDELKAVLPFHAGTKSGADGTILTNGGRVIALSAYGSDIETARTTALAAAEQVNFEGKFFRKDIGQDLLNTP